MINTNSSKPSTRSGRARCPYSMLIEPGGKIVYAQQGAIDAEKLRKIIFDDPYMGRIYK